MLDWIVCLGAERSVAGWQVVCPVSPVTEGLRAVDVADCVICHHLVTACGDRVAAAMCSVEAQVELEGGS